MANALGIQVNSPDLRQLYVDLKNVPGNLRAELRKGVVAAVKPVVTSVQAQASWSTRIPGAVKTKTSFAAKSAGVSVFVDSTIAPEAAPINNKGNTGDFRHPVFADARNQTRDGWTWVAQGAIPFFDKGIASADAAINNAMQAVMDAVIAKAGWK